MMATEVFNTDVFDTEACDHDQSDIEVSDIVVSVSGRDKGKTFFVTGRDGIYAALCDGKSRRIDKPKRKKTKHMRFESKSDCRTAQKLRNGFKVTNSEIRRALAEYQTDSRGEKGGM